MKPQDVTRDEVIHELGILIDKYPDRTGSVDHNEHDGLGCCYYADPFGRPVSLTYYQKPDDSVLKTPVCIVGEWIESFHPEFKNDDLINKILKENATLGGLRDGDHPFSDDVLDVLVQAQDWQDRVGNRWQDIELPLD